MTNYERLKSLPIDELANWLDQYGAFDTAPWNIYFSHKYCDNCEPIEKKIEGLGFHGEPVLCTYCEINDKCIYFPNIEKTPNNLGVIKLWLNAESQGEDENESMDV